MDFRWSRPKNQSNLRTHQQYVEALKPKSYPDFWPRPVENWIEWNKVDGFGEQLERPKAPTAFVTKDST